MTAREESVLTFQATATCRVSKVLKTKIEAPSDSAKFHRLLDRCEMLLATDKYGDGIVASLHRLRALLADSREVAQMVGSDRSLVARLAKIEASYA